MIVLKTWTFDLWLKKLDDLTAKAKIGARLRRIGVHGQLLGDFKSIGNGVIEFRFNCGPGYRVYATQMGDQLLLLVGGDKSSQRCDVDRATKLAVEWRACNE